MSNRPVFGKRNAAPHARPRRTPAVAHATEIQPAHAAFFAAVRAEAADAADERPVVVPLSFKAASLAGLVVGCGLVGFDLTGSQGATQFNALASTLGIQVQIGGSLVPAMMLLGLLGGARTAMLNLLLVHTVLRQARQTSRLAYAAGGAAAAACLAAALQTLLGHAPSHGWAVDLMAGAAGGLLYRVFAGTRPA